MSIKTNEKDDNFFQSVESIPNDLSFDAILVLGGGVPEDINNPPIYTKIRCKLASQLYSSSSPRPKILTLSAGTAHLPQRLSADGLPIWESTASTSYLINQLNVKPSDVYAETTSYDTISNAFFARLNFCDIARWKKIMIITNQFHMERTKLIFDWIFNAPFSETDLSSGSTYELYYLSAPDIGLSEEAIEARKLKESKSASTVKNILSKKYDTVEKIFNFLTSEHSFYTASKLVERGMNDGSGIDTVEKLVQDSYGGVTASKRANTTNISPYLSFANGLLCGIVVMAAIMMLGKKSVHGKRQ